MKIKKPTLGTGSFCFYCNVDSTEMKYFLIVVIGGLVLATVLWGIWAFAMGKFKNVEQIKKQIFEIESRE